MKETTNFDKYLYKQHEQANNIDADDKNIDTLTLSDGNILRTNNNCKIDSFNDTKNKQKK